MCPTTALDRALCPPAAPSPPAPDQPAEAEAVEVRMDGYGHLGQPSQLLWEGRLWLVRHALRLAERSSTGGPEGAGERWRLLAGDGPAGRTVSVVVDRRVGGGWLLYRDAG